ncbi:MAG: efflux RND transporter periplasmic adaptor subunit [Verrucomicrobia bacterium]|nr:efflux RND transporter periplasmic adaptor subunit [Verrucomicrobiota bacterium]
MNPPSQQSTPGLDALRRLQNPLSNLRALRSAGTTSLCLFLAIAAPGAARGAEFAGARPSRGPILRLVTLPGSLRAHQQATLYAKVPGYLKSLAVDIGDRVEAGQALGELEVPELLADRTRYRAEVTVATTEASRMTAARQQAPDLVTPQAVDAATGRLEVARADLERTESLLEFSRLKAPFSGVVTERLVDPGAFIPAATSANTSRTAGGGAVLTLMDFSTVRAQVRMPEQEASLVRVGQPVRVAVEGLPGRWFEARVSRISYALDEATRTMLVEADLPNPALELRPGMYAQVRLGVEEHPDALRIPISALVMEKANAFAFVFEGGLARKRALKTGFNDGVLVEVLGGLSGNETLILPGKQALVDGQAVQITETRQ